MAWVYEGYRIFWDDQGNAVDTVCEHCFYDIPKEELESDDSLLAPHVYITYDMEVDSPLNCDWCHRPLKCSLTDDGAAYVEQAIKAKIEYRRLPDSSSYYAGSPSYQIVLDWADYHSWSCDSDLVERFMDKIIALEHSPRYRVYWKLQGIADKTVRPVTRFLNARVAATRASIEQYGE